MTLPQAGLAALALTWAILFILKAAGVAFHPPAEDLRPSLGPETERRTEIIMTREGER